MDILNSEDELNEPNESSEHYESSERHESATTTSTTLTYEDMSEDETYVKKPTRTPATRTHAWDLIFNKGLKRKDEKYKCFKKFQEQHATAENPKAAEETPEYKQMMVLFKEGKEKFDKAMEEWKHVQPKRFLKLKTKFRETKAATIEKRIKGGGGGKRQKQALVVAPATPVVPVSFFDEFIQLHSNLTYVVEQKHRIQQTANDEEISLLIKKIS